jgi:hypothetical protein
MLIEIVMKLLEQVNFSVIQGIKEGIKCMRSTAATEYTFNVNIGI